MANQVQVIGVKELQAALRKTGEQAREAFRHQLAQSGLELETEAKRQLGSVGAVDTGGTRARTHYRSSDSGMGAEVAAPNPEAAAIEFGTAPAGQLAQHQPPSAPLEAWARRHGMPPGSGYLVARAIRLRGIRARPWLSVAHGKIAPKFIADLKSALNALLGR
jgi:hypothetical protein